MFRIIAAEKTGIYHDAANYSWRSKTDDAPIVAGRASPARLPTIHPLSQVGVLPFDEDRRAGLEKIFFGREKLIVGNEHGAAESFRCEINQLSKVHLRF